MTMGQNISRKNIIKDNKKLQIINNLSKMIKTIHEFNEILHFYKSMTHLTEYPIKLIENKNFSNECINYLNEINIDDLNKDVSIKNFDIKFNDLYQLANFINNDIETYYNNLDSFEKKDFIEYIYCLLHRSLYLLTNYFVNCHK